MKYKGLNNRRPQASHRGFTLVETALATVIIGVGVLSIMAAQQSFHQKNQWSTQLAIAMRLGNEIRELSLNLPHHDPVTSESYWGPEPNENWVGDFDDMDDFDGMNGQGLIFSSGLGNGPINSMREIITDMDGWSQSVSVHNVDPFDITETLEDGVSNMIKVQVIIEYQGPQDPDPVEMTRVGWIVPG